ncbi:HAMP domain-containing sensor histidine kinase [Jeotgalibaca ciconiae]|uniref:Heme sensor protein HssS n=1 Tax=Jeotgalibaca ciconiae TaxID=2496265 RepID=A0A3Q9BIV2_9LACT|nr:HAMP domain-containing sensor histidine kinase [Jeotgalibaca ciconiae]AZP03347.1 HAMP domain-containing histidine kinase [Jeotgalibaca ciconiae]
MRKRKLLPRTILTIVFAIFVFIILTITMAIVSMIIYLLFHTGILREHLISPNVISLILLFGITSIVVGTVVATLISGIPIKPVNTLINGMNELANGNFDVKIDLGKMKLQEDLSDSFNQLSEELNNTEMLRSDFVNNFSHEFKTPIVSIRGFAKLLQKENLPEEKQQEYLTIIIDEISRLADMSTNILDLTKIENQSILTNITSFNLSEQIRKAILLLENKWSLKNLTIDADFTEYQIYANEDLLKQVWINLIDNAIKFSYDEGEISILISQNEDCTRIQVKNNGPEISESEQKRIFNKYWQSDSSRFSEGFGIGLSIAQQIIKLHEGTISIESSPKETIFFVKLPTTLVK